MCELKLQEESSKAGIRWMIRRDLPEILVIEGICFQEPWTEKGFFDCLRQRNCIGRVAETNERVVGFAIYEFHKNDLRLVNIAVHPDFRGRGIGGGFIAELQAKLKPEGRTKITVLVPEDCKKAVPFFKKFDNVEVRFTKLKGFMTYDYFLEPMVKKDTDEVQGIEDDFMTRYGKPPRDITQMIVSGTRYGIVARDKVNGEILGYALYARELSGIDINGEYGIIVKPECQRQGIGRALMTELANQKLPITVSDIFLLCKDQVGFLRAMGVPVPKIEKYITIKWQPEVS